MLYSVANSNALFVYWISLSAVVVSLDQESARAALLLMVQTDKGP